jgi:translation initiation factor IF-3
MAAKKKKVKKKVVAKGRRYSEPDMYREFLRNLLDGTVHVVQLHEQRNARGQLELSYDEEVDDE